MNVATTSSTIEGNKDASEFAPFPNAQLEALQKLLSQSSNQPNARMLATRSNKLVNKRITKFGFLPLV